MLTQAIVLPSTQVLSRPLLEQYYMDAYDAVRKHSSDCFVVFAPRQWETDGLEWNTFMSEAPYTKTLQDIHRCGWSSFVPECYCAAGSRASWNAIT